jgi:NAD(P)-dependent dehydrogenase (short-subunit alcohol dehydrogenase family)
LDRVDYHQCDVSDDDSVTRCMEEIERKAGRIDILVNYAGDKSDSKKSALSMTIAEVSRSFATNALSSVKITLAALPGMISRNYGRIVMMSASDEVLSTLPAGAALGLRMSKSAVFTLTRYATSHSFTVIAQSHIWYL